MSDTLDGLTFSGYLQPPAVPPDPTGDAWRGLTGASGPPGVAGAPGPMTGVATFNLRSGPVTLTSADVVSALAFTPYNAANPAAYIAASGAPVQSVAGRTGSVVLTHSDLTDWTAATAGFGATYSLPTASTTVLGGVRVDGSSVTISGGVISASGVGAGVATFNTRSGTVVLSSADVTAALTFTPYSNANPAGYQTAANVTATLAPYALSSAVPAASGVAPVMNGVATVGVATAWAHGDHVHPVDTSRYAASNPSSFIAASGAPVQSVASRTGAVTLTHADLTDWASATSGFGAGYTLPTASTTVLGGIMVDGVSVTIAAGVISASGGTGGGSGTIIATLAQGII